MKSMPKSLWVGMILVAMLAGPMAAEKLFGQADRADAAAHDHADHGEADTLHQHMEVINDQFRQLRRVARRRQFGPDTLQMVVRMQKHALAAKQMSFPRAERLDETQKKQMVLGFRKDMIRMIETLLDLELAILEDRPEDAADLVSSLAAAKSDGHEKYQKQQ